MTVMADAFPASGQVVAPVVAPLVDDAAGPAGGVGPVPAGGLHDAVAEAADPFTSALHGPPGHNRHPPARAEAPGLVPQRLEWLVMLVAGIGLITAVSWFRRRQRLRQGWGMLPKRGGQSDRL
jgi:hypothetical protein